MATLHIRQASVNTSLDPLSQSQDDNTNFPRPRTPAHSRSNSFNPGHSRTSSFNPGHARFQSVTVAEKVGGDLDAAEPLLEDKRIIVPALNAPQKSRNTKLIGLWILSMVLVSFFTYALSKPRTTRDGLGSFEKGYATDLKNARPSIQLQRQQFYGSLDFKDRHGFIPNDSPSLQYVGASDTVDAAWDELTKDRYFLLSDTEAQQAYGNDPSIYWNVHHGGYVAGLDVLHTLHCLNHLRQSLYPEHYPQDPEHGTMHKAHCIDHLRQLAMCNADLTPVPTQWFDGLQRNYINSSREHTCRDFGTVREWASERFNGSTAVKARNRDGSLRDDFYAPWTP